MVTWIQKFQVTNIYFEYYKNLDFQQPSAQEEISKLQKSLSEMHLIISEIKNSLQAMTFLQATNQNLLHQTYPASPINQVSVEISNDQVPVVQMEEKVILNDPINLTSPVKQESDTSQIIFTRQSMPSQTFYGQQSPIERPETPNTPQKYEDEKTTNDQTSIDGQQKLATQVESPTQKLGSQLETPSKLWPTSISNINDNTPIIDEKSLRQQIPQHDSTRPNSPAQTPIKSASPLSPIVYQLPTPHHTPKNQFTILGQQMFYQDPSLNLPQQTLFAQNPNQELENFVSMPDINVEQFDETEKINKFEYQEFESDHMVKNDRLNSGEKDIEEIKQDDHEIKISQEIKKHDTFGVSEQNDDLSGHLMQSENAETNEPESDMEQIEDLDDLSKEADEENYNLRKIYLEQQIIRENLEDSKNQKIFNLNILICFRK